MTDIETGAQAIEAFVRERAATRGVALTHVTWNGVEGLNPSEPMQTLFATATQKTGRAMVTTEQVLASISELPPPVREVVDRLIDDVHLADESGEHPRGGGG